MRHRTCKRCARIDAEVQRLADTIIAAANRNSQSDQYDLVVQVIHLTLDRLGLSIDLPATRDELSAYSAPPR